jgi:hypothetical protein
MSDSILQKLAHDLNAFLQMNVTTYVVDDGYENHYTVECENKYRRPICTNDLKILAPYILKYFPLLPELEIIHLIEIAHKYDLKILLHPKLSEYFDGCPDNHMFFNLTNIERKNLIKIYDKILNMTFVFKKYIKNKISNIIPN